MFIIKAILIAISMYSALPMPQFEWSEKPMRYAIAFFPFVGIVTGGLFYLWFLLCGSFGIPDAVRTGVAAALPVLVTGGIHIDGFMDTTDALRSYQSREKRLDILKDPHIGAFAVIGVLTYFILLLSGLSVLNMTDATILAGGFVLARSFSGLSVATFRNAKGEGSLYAFSSGLSKRVTIFILLTELVLSSVFMIWVNPLRGGVAVAVALCVFVYYRFRSYRVFGGITGDLAGWFLCLAEIGMVLGLAALRIGLPEQVL
ncbi:MAG: adenosylcobinamide-GDP ribazoletransferase [Lachnospiraceae bacterium]|nr:adenosylcobinamide-GDP ribazoletransferase [Lachnospiraceae bacterium]